MKDKLFIIFFSVLMGLGALGSWAAFCFDLYLGFILICKNWLLIFPIIFIWTFVFRVIDDLFPFGSIATYLIVAFILKNSGHPFALSIWPVIISLLSIGSLLPIITTYFEHKEKDKKKKEDKEFILDMLKNGDKPEDIIAAATFKKLLDKY